MRKLVLAISALALAGSAALADPIADRKALMKANGAAVGKIAPMVRGAQPFDAAVALEALKTLADDAQKMEPAVLWPAGSDKGDTKSSPKIWEDAAGFKAAVDKFRADTAAAVAAPPQDLDQLKTKFGAIGANCSGCHQACSPPSSRSHGRFQEAGRYRHRVGCRRRRRGLASVRAGPA